MTCFVVDNFALEEVKDQISRLRLLAEVVEYSHLPQWSWPEQGCAMFTGISVMTEERLALVREIQENIPPGVQVLNRVGQMQHRHRWLAANGRFALPARELRGAEFPLVLRYDHASGGMFDTPQIWSAEELNDVLTDLIVRSYPLDEIWGVSCTEDERIFEAAKIGETHLCPPALQAEVQRLFSSAGVDAGRLFYSRRDDQIVPWRIDDSAYGIVPHVHLLEKAVAGLAAGRV